MNQAAGETTTSRIVVLGGLNADLVVAVPRLPRRAETVMGDRLMTFPGGKGANQAVAAARLGGAVTMVGRVGRDAFGDMLLQSLQADGVDTDAIARDEAEPTGVALILVEHGGQNMIAVAPGANGQVGMLEVERTAGLLNARTWLLLQLEVPLAAVEATLQAAHRLGSRVILNAAPAIQLPDRLLGLVDVLLVNEVEASTLFGLKVETPTDAAKAGHVALERGVGAALVTLGAAGVVLVDEGGVTPIAPHPVVALDATAAGDAFVGALAVGLARGDDLRSAARLGSAAGAAAASRPGAQSSLPRTDELRTMLC